MDKNPIATPLFPHKKLKYYIVKHPELINIHSVIERKTEHPFRSGDVVDIFFQCKDGVDYVVEIETDIPVPGAYQAIKYRELRCVERNRLYQVKKFK